MSFKLFLNPHLKSILTEIEKGLNVNNIDEAFDEIFNKRIAEEENARKQVIESFKHYDSIENTHLKYSTLMNFILNERKALDRSSNTLLGKLFIRYLNDDISDEEVKKYLVFKIYDNAFANNYTKSFEFISKEFYALLLPYYRYKFYITAINRIFHSNNPGSSNEIIDIETSLTSKLIKQLQDALEENISLAQENKKVLTENMDFYYEIETLKSKKESLRSKIDGYKLDIKTLQQQINYLQFTDDQLYEDYIFGDYLMIYEKIYRILRYYKSFKEPFSVFCYCLQKHKTSRVIKRGLTTNKYVTLNILGYMFNCLFKFSISKSILSKQFDLISFLEPRFFIINARKQEKPLPERYLKDIIKETSLTQDEIIVKDKIDSIFDPLL